MSGQCPLAQEGDHYRSYQTTETEVIRTEGIVTRCTGDKQNPYEITCTKADTRGYVGKIVAASAAQVYGRTTKSQQQPTQEEQKLLSCGIYTDYWATGLRSGLRSMCAATPRRPHYGHPAGLMWIFTIGGYDCPQITLGD